MTMDRRLAERRRRVAEDRARSNLGRLVRVLAVVAAVAFLVWLAQSPLVSVSDISVRGADRVDVAAVLELHGVTEGRPMLVVDVAGAEEALAQDPWVEAVTVARDWPRKVVVEVNERVPAAVVEFSDGPWLAAADGTVLAPADGDRSDLPRAVLPALAAADREDLVVGGAVEYLVSLPDRYRKGAVVINGSEGLEGTVAGHRVRIGPPFDISEKAAVTAAMIDGGVEAGAVLTVVAPANPAVLPPDADLDAPATTAP